MQLIRLAASTELNNACIVGFLAVCALVVTWLVITLSIFLIRQAGKSLRIEALQAFTDGYARKARLAAVIVSFAIVVAAAGVLGYALWQHKDLEPAINKLLAQI